jgi:chromate transporter
MADDASAGARPPARLAELAVLFLRLGFTAFGGPAAHIALMENEIVRRRRWLSSERFLDLLGATNLIPGPSSTELAIFIGYEEAGWPGLVLGGVCFILPAAVMVTVLAWAYVRFGTVPQIAGILYGIKPVVIAVVTQALWGLAPKAIKKSLWLGALGIVAYAASALKVDALSVLVGAGVASVARRHIVKGGGTARGSRTDEYIRPGRTPPPAAHPQRHRARVDAGSAGRGQRHGICASSYSQWARWVVRRTPDRFRDV